jgi:two-component sensor histidine kinase
VEHERSIKGAISRTHFHWLVLPLVFVMLLVMFVTFRDVFVRLRATRDQAYQFASSTVGNHLTAIQEELVRAGQIGLLATASPEEASQVLRILLNRGDRFHDLALINADRRILTSVHRDHTADQWGVGDLAYRSAIFNAFLTGEVCVGVAELDRSTVPVIAICVPLADIAEGTVARVLHTHASWRDVSSALAAGLLSDARVRIRSEGIVVADSAGFVLQRATDRSGLRTGEGRDQGPALLHSVRSFDASGLTYEVIVDLDRANVAYIVVANLLTILLVVAVLAWSAGRLRHLVTWQVVVPVQQLAYHTQLVQRLDTEPAPLPRYEITEMDELAQAIQAMEKRIGTQFHELVAADEANRVLLREVHHRVKNNLQTIRSLIHMQRVLGSYPEKLDRSLAMTETRVNTLATVHDHLVEREHRYTVEIRTLLTDLVHSLLSARTENGMRIESRVAADECMVDVAVASPIGQIVSEAVTNSLLHAFTGRSSGDIAVLFEVRDESGDALLRIEDNGPGCPAERTPGLGFQIIDLLARQLGGNGRIFTDGGCVVEVTVPLPERGSDAPGKPGADET